MTNGNIYTLAVNVDGHIYAGSYGGGVWYSTNNGELWTEINNGIGEFIKDFTVVGTKLLAATLNGIFISTDNGTTWSAGGYSSVMTDLSVSGSNIFSGTTSSGVCLSTDEGISGNPMNNGITTLNIQCVEATERMFLQVLSAELFFIHRITAQIGYR